MTNEIKEILEEMYDIQVRYTKPLLKRNYTDKDYAIEKYENLVFKMKNIITNLQEENERLKTTQIFIDTQDPEERCGQALYEEMLKRDCENYKQRIDKAVEYINKYEYEKYCPSPYEKNKYIMREEKEGQDLLNILQGDE